MALCTFEDVENRLGGQDLSSDQTLIEALIDAAQAHIERIAGRAIEADDYTETFDAPDSPNVWVVRTPINSVTSVTVDGTALTSSQYSHDPESGRVTRVVNDRPRSWSTYKVQSIAVAYNGGYATVPEDLVDICARAAARAYQAGAAAEAVPTSGVKQINLAGSDSVTLTAEATDPTSAVFLTPDEQAVAAYYRPLYL